MHAPRRSTLALTIMLAMAASAVGRAQTTEPPQAPTGAQPGHSRPGRSQLGRHRPPLAAMPPTT